MLNKIKKLFFKEHQFFFKICDWKKNDNFFSLKIKTKNTLALIYEIEDNVFSKCQCDLTIEDNYIYFESIEPFNGVVNY